MTQRDVIIYDAHVLGAIVLRSLILLKSRWTYCHIVILASSPMESN